MVGVIGAAKSHMFGGFTEKASEKLLFVENRDHRLAVIKPYKETAFIPVKCRDFPLLFVPYDCKLNLLVLCCWLDMITEIHPNFAGWFSLFSHILLVKLHNLYKQLTTSSKNNQHTTLKNDNNSWLQPYLRH